MVKLLYEGVEIMSKYKVEMIGYPSDYPQLTHQQTMDKLNQYHLSHDEQIKDELVLSNVKLVLSLVQKYQQRTNNLDDLFQVGIIGLIKAIDHFDTTLNVRFSTYAVPLIVGEIKRYLRDNSPLRVPRSMRDLAYKALLENEQYMKKHNKEASVEELARRLDVNETLLVEALSSTNSVSSLSQEVQNDGNGQIELINQIANPKNELEHYHDHLDLHNALKILDDKEKLIIQQRYFQDQTQSEIAKELFISQAQVSRIEKQALSHLKKYMS